MAGLQSTVPGEVLQGQSHFQASTGLGVKQGRCQAYCRDGGHLCVTEIMTHSIYLLIWLQG